MDNKFEQLDQNKILSLKWSNFGKELNISYNNLNYICLKHPELIEVIKRRLNIGEGLKNALFTEGLDCEALRFGKKGWQKGKVKIKLSVEFCPDEPEVEEASANNDIIQPESPLDDLRQMMKQNE